MAKMIRNGYTVGASNGVVNITKAEYDALPDSKLTDGKLYLIQDADNEMNVSGWKVFNSGGDISVGTEASIPSSFNDLLVVVPWLDNWGYVYTFILPKILFTDSVKITGNLSDSTNRCLIGFSNNGVKIHELKYTNSTKTTGKIAIYYR